MIIMVRQTIDNTEPFDSLFSRPLSLPFAKATFVRTQRMWKIFRMRADLKWNSYPPMPEVNTVEDFLEAVEKDEYHCFFGQT